jgi:hypothetical protein
MNARRDRCHRAAAALAKRKNERVLFLTQRPRRSLSAAVGRNQKTSWFLKHRGHGGFHGGSQSRFLVTPVLGCVRGGLGVVRRMHAEYTTVRNLVRIRRIEALAVQSGDGHNQTYSVHFIETRRHGDTEKTFGQFDLSKGFLRASVFPCEFKQIFSGYEDSRRYRCSAGVPMILAAIFRAPLLVARLETPASAPPSRS